MGLLGLAGVISTGCTQPQKPAGTPIEQAWEAPVRAPIASAVVAESPSTQPGSGSGLGLSQEDPDDVIATVNGRPITRRPFVEALVKTHGLSLFQQMILLTAAEQRGAEMGLTITPADLEAEQEDALRRISLPIGGEGGPLDRPAAERLLREFMEAKNISRPEWELRMQQRAWIRKIAAADVEKQPVTEAMLREEYALTFGERVQIRHVQVASLAAVERLQASLAASKDFSAVARQFSENQITGAGGGLLAPFARNEQSVPPLIREAAFSMQPGDISQPLQVDNWYHLIRLERRFPASSVRFENADRDMLRRRLVDRLIRQEQEKLEEELFRSARIDIRNDTLRRQFREKFQR